MSQIMCFCVWHNMRIVEKLPRHSDTRDGGQHFILSRAFWRRTAFSLSERKAWLMADSTTRSACCGVSIPASKHLCSYLRSEVSETVMLSELMFTLTPSSKNVERG